MKYFIKRKKECAKGAKTLNQQPKTGHCKTTDKETIKISSKVFLILK